MVVFTAHEATGSNTAPEAEKLPVLSASSDLIGKSNRKEVFWNIVNSGLAGALVFFGACTAGGVTWQSIAASLGAACLAALVQFKKYWESERGEYCSKTAFSFLGG